jgi:hypothetical protein
MHPTAFAAPDPHRLARAFLALGDEDAPERLRRSPARTVAAFAAALVLAVAAPLTWTGPFSASAPGKVGEPPAATLGNSKAVLGAADDDEDDGAG